MINEFLEYLKFEKRSSLCTIKAYNTDILQFDNYLKEYHITTKIENTDSKQIREWATILIRKNISEKSINRKLASLRTFFKFLVKNKKCKSNPVSIIKSLKVQNSLPNFISQKDILEFIKEYKFDNTFEGYRDKLIFELFYGTGIRLSELINLKIDDIKWDINELKVIGKGNKQRIIPIPNPIMEIISKYISYRKNLNASKDFITKNLLLTSKGKNAYPMLIQRIIKKYLYFLSAKNKISPHILRHSYATHLLDKGADITSIKELLGHSNLSTTQIYTHVSIDRLKKVIKQTHPRG